MAKPFFPMFVDLSDRRALVVGGGRIASRRAGTLSLFCGRVTVVAPQISPVLCALEGVTLVERPFDPGDLEGVALAVAATNDAALNAHIGALCRQRGIPVNVASDQTLCDFFFPGVAVKGDVAIGITASGKDHRLAAQWTRRVRELV